MAQRTLIQLIDDIDGSEGSETVTFGLDGATYEIDLSDKNAAALRKSLSKYVGAGRKLSKARGKTSGTGSKAGATGSKTPPKIVREWAVKNGHTVPERGRIPDSVQAAYDAAHSNAA